MKIMCERRRACALDQPRSASGPFRGQESWAALWARFAAAQRPAPTRKNTLLRARKGPAPYRAIY